MLMRTKSYLESTLGLDMVKEWKRGSFLFITSRNGIFFQNLLLGLKRLPYGNLQVTDRYHLLNLFPLQNPRELSKLLVNGFC